MTLLIVYLTIAIGVSFLCSVLEAVLLSISSSYVANVSKEKPKAGKRLEKVREKLDESLSSILILNTFAHTMGAAGVGSQALQIFGAEWETLIAITLTLVILYFSEIIPKTLGATYWKPLAIPASTTILWLIKLVFPLVWSATLLTSLFSRKKRQEITREEIIAMASLMHKDGSLISQENQYLSNVLSLHDITTEDVLTPRTVVHMLPQDTSVTDALEMPDTKRFSRIPIFWNDTDHVSGHVFRSDLYEAERTGKGSAPVSDYSRPIERVSEKLPVQQLLDRFIKTRAHMFLVEDEFGQTSGIVTLEDAIETLLGREIVDESDTVVDMQELARGKYRDRLRRVKQEKDSDQ
ncbi:MAG: CNNM domain-containing protein [Pseudomonadota bacterium]